MASGGPGGSGFVNSAICLYPLVPTDNTVRDGFHDFPLNLLRDLPSFT